MKKTFAIITADWHIRPFGKLWKNKSYPQGDIQFAIQQIEKLVETHKPKYVIIAGDILDTAKNYTSSLDILKRVNNWNTTILYVQGQHDKASPPWLDLIKQNNNIIHMHQKILEDDEYDITFYGLDYMINPEEGFTDESKNANILITHQVWSDIIRDGNFTFQNIPDNFKYVISGDYHSLYTPTIGNKNILIPGTVIPNNITETPPFYVLMLDTDLNYNPHELQSRHIVTWNLDDFKTERELFDSVKELKNNSNFDTEFEDVKKPLIRLKGSNIVQLNKIKNSIEDAYVILDIVIDIQNSSEIIHINSEDGFIRINDLFINYFEEKYPHYLNAVKTTLDCFNDSGQDKEQTIEKIIYELRQSWESKNA